MTQFGYQCLHLTNVENAQSSPGRGGGDRVGKRLHFPSLHLFGLTKSYTDKICTHLIKCLFNESMYKNLQILELNYNEIGGRDGQF